MCLCPTLEPRGMFKLRVVDNGNLLKLLMRRELAAQNHDVASWQTIDTENQRTALSTS